MKIVRTKYLSLMLALLMAPALFSQDKDKDNVHKNSQSLKLSQMQSSNRKRRECIRAITGAGWQTAGGP